MYDVGACGPAAMPGTDIVLCTSIQRATAPAPAPPIEDDEETTNHKHQKIIG